MTSEDPQPTPESAKCPSDVSTGSQPDDVIVDVMSVDDDDDNMPLDLSICSSKKSHCSSPKTLIGSHNRREGVDLSICHNGALEQSYSLVNGDLANSLMNGDITNSLVNGDIANSIVNPVANTIVNPIVNTVVIVYSL